MAHPHIGNEDDGEKAPEARHPGKHFQEGMFLGDWPKRFQEVARMAGNKAR